ncbi:4Fe-4S dicluster domain-containing protein [Natranaerobius thermophilus]|uniref:4Fe-4S ferredoxin iron-sulfur binding domain protein n=1 Tax=Natranaerobius thermophilus (strain ATCC BAA-1301 / DSM 18059 / JW/NM-WN-LF) TaxID=457570 RepID=B2A6C3_NATTJ|nr:4Fe-4S dicluster domain-containing protein [Natranaerobius thermophilus]ACB84134.1 4Fe-4S ferredoxin iron-sulfur binding domain protein [Natranaerobius thermophilus JW/NM-WN-LF]
MKENKGFKLKRRQFIQSMAGTGLLAGLSLSAPRIAEAGENNGSEYAMMVDKTECVGCNACTRVCSEAYELSEGILRTEIHRFKDDEDEEYFKKNACLHCNEASCVMACPADAIYKDDLGLTQIDNSICVNCGYCVSACPYNAIKYDRKKGVNEKCTLCTELINAGSEPLCKQECPVDAIYFGTREEMLELGREKVSDLKDQGYDKAMLYGDDEFDGLAVLGVLHDEPQEYELPKDPQIPMQLRVWNQIPFAPAFLVVGGAAMVFNFLHSRKTKAELEQPEEDEE